MKEKLIQAIERFLSGCVPPPDEILKQLFEVLQTLQLESIENKTHAVRLHSKQGILVIKTGIKGELDLNQLTHQMREDQIQHINS